VVFLVEECSVLLCTLDWMIIVLSCLVSSSLIQHAVVPCGAPNDIANGQRVYGGTPGRQTATYSCNTGYNLVGNRTRTCQPGGVWSGSEPTCEGVLLLSTSKWRERISQVWLSLVPRPHPLTRRNGLVNQVEFLGLAGTLATL